MINEPSECWAPLINACNSGPWPVWSGVPEDVRNLDGDGVNPINRLFKMNNYNFE